MPALTSMATKNSKKFPFQVGFNPTGVRKWLCMMVPTARIRQITRISPGGSVPYAIEWSLWYILTALEPGASNNGNKAKNRSVQLGMPALP